MIDEAAAWRYNLVWDTNPLIRKKHEASKQSKKLIPVHEKIAILKEQIDTCKAVIVGATENIKQLEAELAIFEDEQ